MYFKIYQDSARQWRWTLLAANHRKIADSGEGYTSKQACLYGLNLIRGPDGPPIIDG